STPACGHTQQNHSNSHIPSAPRSPPSPYTTLFRSSTVFERDRVNSTEQSGILVQIVERWLNKPFGRMRYIQPVESEVDRLLDQRSEEHTSELQSRLELLCRLLLAENIIYSSFTCRS